MRKFTFFVAVAAMVAATGCDPKTGYNFDQQADFSKYKTYQWVELKDSGLDQLNEIERRAVADALDKAMAAKGLTKTDSETSDLVTGYQVGFNQQQEFTTYNSGGPWGWGPGWGPGWGWGYGYGYGGGISTTTSRDITVGTLALDMYDREAKRLVWRGQVSDTVDRTRDQEKRLKRLDNAMTALLKNYPPKRDN